jgi:hypothetical protein
MLKSIATIAASTAALAAVSMTPAAAAQKAPQAQDGLETSMFAPAPGTDVVESRRGHGHRIVFFSAAPYYAYRNCYWGWRYGKKVWICY